MLKKSITFTDFDGETKTKDYYFNLTKAECIDLQMSIGAEGGFADVMVAAVENEDKGKMIEIFKDLILRSYGVRVGGDFLKSPEHSAAFATTEAFSALFMEIINQHGAAIEFFKGVMPADLISQADAMPMSEIREKLNLPKTSRLDAQFEEQQAARAQRPKNPRMTKEEILAGMRRKSKGWPKELTIAEVEEMSQDELDDAIAAGCTLAEYHL